MDDHTTSPPAADDPVAADEPATARRATDERAATDRAGSVHAGRDTGDTVSAANGAAGSAGEPTEVPVERRNRLLVLLAATAVVVLTVDQLTKIWAVEALTGRGRVDLVGDLFGLRLIRNSGAAFSFATGWTWVLTVLAVGVVAAIIRYARRLGSRAWALTLGLLVGGAVGNLVDRFFREPGFARGHVVDFFELPHYPIFNVADSCIVTAAVLIAWLGLRGVGVDGSRAGR